MDVQEVLSQVRDAINVNRVFGEPVEKDGVTVVPVASVRGGGGGGGDNAGNGGTGFGLSARPVGVYVIKDGEVRWEPTMDLSRVILGGQITAVILFLTFRSLIKARGKTKRQKLRTRG